VRLDDIDSARDSITTLDGATDQVNFARAKLGAMQQRLQVTYNQLGDYEQALGEAGSRRRDADLARETAELARALVLQRAGVAVLAQANSQPLAVLRLLD
jgi:flagellin